MSKFCDQCGSKLPDIATFCGNCGAKCLVEPEPISAYDTYQIQDNPQPQIATETQSVPVVPQPIAVSAPTTPPVEHQRYVPQNYSSAPVKKSRKKFLIPIIALILVVAIGVSAFFIFSPFSSNTPKDYYVAGKDLFILQNSYGTYYQGGLGLFEADGDDDMQPITTIDGNILYADAGKSVCIDNAVYFVDQNSDFSGITKCTFSGDYALETEQWLSQEDMEVDGYDNEKFARALINSSYNWQHYDGYIYFAIFPTAEFFTSHVEFAHLMGRINIKNKDIEIIDHSIGVFDYVVYDGWIYYSECGWIKSLERKSYDTEKAGIYKIKTDGNKKTKLLDINYTGLDSINSSSIYSFSKLSVYNDMLYFIDNSDPENSILNRMALDGSNVSAISSQGTYEYTFNADTNDLYYVTSSTQIDVDDVKEIYQLSLDDFTEKKIIDYSNRSDRIFLSCLNNKLYIHSPYQKFGQYSGGTEEDPVFAGIYYDLKNNEATAAYSYELTETTSRDFLGSTIETTEVVGKVCYWDDYDPEYELFTFYN